MHHVVQWVWGGSRLFISFPYLCVPRLERVLDVDMRHDQQVAW